MSNETNSDPKGQWSQAAAERRCYCGLWDKDPDTLLKQNLKPGYCGYCDWCHAPGHSRHFPGPLPITGAWCDRCYRIVKWTAPLRTSPIWLIVIGCLLAVVWKSWSHIVSLVTLR